MIYGCIGERLPHSFSKEIHEKIGSYSYELRELTRDELKDFMIKKDFRAINVTIPYKQSVIPFLDRIDEAAEKICAVNTVVNVDGKLFGYNTDHIGMNMLINKSGIVLKGKKVLVLGTGGTSHTARYVAENNGARDIITVSRSEKPDAVTYSEMYRYHNDADFIINTTPCGMYPDTDSSPVDILNFNNLSGVVDAVYNPLKTKLVLSAENNGIRAVGGLYMLVAQAVSAYELFMGVKCEIDTVDSVFSQIFTQKQNIVLTGMPGSGKTTIGKIIAEKTNRRFFDTDELIIESEKRSVNEIFASSGEEYFRSVESKIICELSEKNGVVIATGGGSILKDENIEKLRMNGKLYFLDRSVDKLIPTSDRPLALNREAIIKRYNERYSKYIKTADETVKADSTPAVIADLILERHGYENTCY